MRSASLLMLTGFMAGCGNQLAARQAYLSRFVGQPEVALVQQMGVPARTYATSGVKYLAYDEHQVGMAAASRLRLSICNVRRRSR
jgi:hypothetical protein